MNVQRAVCCGVVFSAAFAILGPVGPVAAQGQWSYTTPATWNKDAVHFIHMFTGNVLAWEEPFAGHAELWDLCCNLTDVGPAPQQLPEIGCAGLSQLKNGLALIVGGGLGVFFGPGEETWTFRSGTWTQKQSMSVGRYYPTITALGDGRVLALGGGGLTPICQATGSENVCFPSIYNPDNDTWTDFTNPDALLDVGQYPFAFLLNNGKLAVVGSNVLPVVPFDQPAILDLSTSAPYWGLLSTHSFVSKNGSAVMFEPGRVLKCGGKNEGGIGIANTDIINFNDTNPSWAGDIPNMVTPRADHTLVVAADGKIWAMCGQDDAAQYIKKAEWFDPANPYNGWHRLQEEMHDGRAYHSTAALLPDGTVLVAGDNGSSTPADAEIFTPPYLLTGNPRPLITFAPAGASYGQIFNIRVSGVPANQLTRVCLVRLAAVTHGFDQNQRYVPLVVYVPVFYNQNQPVTLSVAAPANENVAPPGYYMLFVLSDTGGPPLTRYVPSVAHYFQLFKN